MIEIDELYLRRYSISEHLDSRGIQFQLSLWFWDLYSAYYCVHTSYSNFVFFSVHWFNLMSFFSLQDPDTECTNSPAATSKFRRKKPNYSDDSVLSNEVTDVTDYSNECDSFRAHLESRCANEMEGSPHKNSKRKERQKWAVLSENSRFWTKKWKLLTWNVRKCVTNTQRT